jgi:hypothetical protein
MGLIQGGGFNGTAGISSEGDYSKSTAFKSNAGDHFHGTLGKFAPIVSRVTFFAGADSARHSCNGPMTL